MTSTQKIARRHDFTAKLRQPSVHSRVVDYVAWQRDLRAATAAGTEAPPTPDWAPISINLDLTTACNYACDHCIDWDILNSPIKYKFEKLKSSLTNMAEKGMRSVIMIGGGEPTIHPGFEETVRHLKGLGMQVAIVSNGSRNDRILNIMEVLEEGDWVRLSLDSGTDDTFQRMHHPKQPITLEEICAWVPKLRERNPAPLVGFSYIIVWGGAEREEGATVVPNIDEIVQAARLARDNQFSYISLKPFLTRKEDGAEVMDPEAAGDLESIVAKIRAAVDEAKELDSEEFRVIESINLVVLEKGNWRDFTSQPKTCHMQSFRQVLTPLGLYNCPAHRGVEKAKIGGMHSYSDDEQYAAATEGTAAIIGRFDASHECAEVTCLYHSVNWWIENAIEGKVELEGAGDERNDFFL